MQISRVLAGPTTVVGTFSALGAGANGATIAVHVGVGDVDLPLAARARVVEQQQGHEDRPASLADLVAGEPVVVKLDDAGAAAEIDAIFGAVPARAVVVSGGYLVTTAARSYKLTGAAVGKANGVRLGTYVLLRTDPDTGDVFDLSTSATSFDKPAAARVVAITFTVRVPNNTPPGDAVFMATSAQSWTPNAVRMKPLPGNAWTATLTLTGGTLLQYKYTRGSWLTAERDPAGAEIKNRSLTVDEHADAQRVEDAVARWADLQS